MLLPMLLKLIWILRRMSWLSRFQSMWFRLLLQWCLSFLILYRYNFAFCIFYIIFALLKFFKKLFLNFLNTNLFRWFCNIFDRYIFLTKLLRFTKCIAMILNILISRIYSFQSGIRTHCFLNVVHLANSRSSLTCQSFFYFCIFISTFLTLLFA